MDLKSKALELCLRYTKQHHRNLAPLKTECITCGQFEEVLSQAFEAGKREGKIEAYRDAAIRIGHALEDGEHDYDGLAQPIMAMAAALEKE